MVNTVETSAIDALAWAIRSTCHTVLKASPGAAIFGQDMLFGIPFLADCTKLETTGNAKLSSTQSVKNFLIL